MLCYCSTNQMFTWLLIADEIQSPLSLFGTLVSVTSPFLPASCSQHENLCSGQNGLPNSESFLRAKTRAHAYFSRSPVTTSRLLGMSWEKITAHLTEQSFGSSPPTPSFNWTAKTRRGNRTCSGLHTEVLIDPELEQQAAGSSMSIFFRYTSLSKRKVPIRGTKSNKADDDYNGWLRLFRGHEKESWAEADVKALLQYIINCWLLCIVPIMNSATICRITLPAGPRNGVPVSSEDCSWVGVLGRLWVTGSISHSQALPVKPPNRWFLAAGSCQCRERCCTGSLWGSHMPSPSSRGQAHRAWSQPQYQCSY